MINREQFMLLLIDNYDSFTYNIVQYFEKLSQNVIVKRNDEINCKEIDELAPDYIVVGPGPCTPIQAGISIEVIKTFANKIPILGVCLGHQAIGEAFGGKTVRAQTIMHGKNSLIYHNNIGVFNGIINPISCTRYHSLVISRDFVPSCLEVHARTDDGEIMGVIHKVMPIEGVQFHPEALLSDFGYEIFNNFLTKYK